MPDALRLALGTLTAVRVPPPRRVDRRVAGRAMLLAPVVGLLLALACAVVLDGTRLLDGEEHPSATVALLASALTFGALALLTRGLHLDGLADTADALGVKGDDEGVRSRRLEVMRAPDVGAFGAVTLVLVLIVQVAALTQDVMWGYGTVSLVVALVTGRLAALWSCTSSVPSARPDGLGALVAGSVGRGPALVVTAVVLAGAAALGRLDDDRGLSVSLTLLAAVLGGLLVAAVLRRRAVERFGGITGDVLGAIVEIATATSLVVVAVGAGLG